MVYARIFVRAVSNPGPPDRSFDDTNTMPFYHSAICADSRVIIIREAGDRRRRERRKGRESEARKRGNEKGRRRDGGRERGREGEEEGK